MDINDLKALISVIEHGSLQAAATATRQSRTTLRRRLQSLEALVGRTLLVHGSTGTVPTPEGRELALRGRRLVEEASLVVDAVRTLDVEVEGEVRALFPTGLHPDLLALSFAVARSRLPRVSFRFALADDPLAVLPEQVELLLHFGAAPTHGPWISTLVLETPEHLVASPEYLASNGTPTTLGALAGHRLLCWQPRDQDATRLPLLDGGSLKIRPALVASDVHLLRLFAAQGMGIAFVPDPIMSLAPETRGGMVRVLPDVVGRACALRAMVPEALAQLPRGRALLDMVHDIVAMLGGPLSASGHPMSTSKG